MFEIRRTQLSAALSPRSHDLGKTLGTCCVSYRSCENYKAIARGKGTCSGWGAGKEKRLFPNHSNSLLLGTNHFTGCVSGSAGSVNRCLGYALVLVV